MPLVLARIYEEDTKFDTQQKKRVYQTSPSAMQREQLSESEQFMEKLNGHLDHRNQAARSSLVLDSMGALSLSQTKNGNRVSTALDGDFDDLATEASESAATALYRRGTLVEASWTDFELLSIIGRGTFGKVYLVACKPTGKYYAMKCIRKDVVIKHESVESL